MTFATGLEALLEKAAAWKMRPAVAGNPFPAAPRTDQSTWTNPAQARNQAATANYAQAQARQNHDPLMREVNNMGQQNYAASPTAAPVAAPAAAQRRGFLGRAAVPLALAGVGAAVAGGLGLKGQYDEDQKYKNLAYAPVGPNAY